MPKIVLIPAVHEKTAFDSVVTTAREGVEIEVSDEDLKKLNSLWKDHRRRQPDYSYVYRSDIRLFTF